MGIDHNWPEPETLTGCPQCHQSGRCMWGCLHGVHHREMPDGRFKASKCGGCTAGAPGYCRVCGGEGMVTATVAAAWRAANPGNKPPPLPRAGLDVKSKPTIIMPILPPRPRRKG